MVMAPCRCSAPWSIRQVPRRRGGSLSGPLALASLSRELSANDWQDRTDARRGDVEDRNVELVLPAPFVTGRGDEGRANRLDANVVAAAH